MMCGYAVMAAAFQDMAAEMTGKDVIVEPNPPPPAHGRGRPRTPRRGVSMSLAGPGQDLCAPEVVQPWCSRTNTRAGHDMEVVVELVERILE
jgi:hypothetical protein